MDWIGVLEECDWCHDEYPMSWIIFTGQEFVCFDCYWNKRAGDRLAEFLRTEPDP